MIRLLFILLSFCSCAFAEEWRPLNEFADTDGKCIVISSSNNPRYTYDSTGRLVPIDPYQKELEWVGNKQYYRRTAMPISAGLLKYATHEGLEWLSSAKDWGTDRGIEWTLWDVEWNGTHSLPEIDTPQWVDENLQEAGEYQVWNSPTTVRRAVAIPAVVDSTNFTVTYRFRLHDLRISNEIDSASEFIPDPTTGCFTITTMGGQGRFVIRLPKLLDADWNVLPGELNHRMRLVESDLVEYIKYPGESLTVEQLRSATLLDVVTSVYGMSNDGWINKTGASTWPLSRTATTGSGLNAGGSYVTQGAAGLKTNWECIRSFLEFDTTFLTSYQVARVINLQLKLSPWGSYTCEVSLYKGTQSDSLVVADFDNFGNEIARQNWNNSDWNTFDITGQATYALNSGGKTKFCLRNYVYDVNGNEPTDDNSAAGLRYSEYADNTYDPVLIIDLASQSNNIFYIQNNSR